VTTSSAWNHNDCPMSTCAAPAGSPCRTGKGKVAIHLRDQEMSLRDIAARLIITTGKKKGQH
jgi:hypothetical protein